MKTIITSPYEPTPEIQSKDGIRAYVLKLKKLTRSDLCTELSNVMAAKHNQMMIPTGIDKTLEKQQIVTDLTDKAVFICILEFGHEFILGYGDGDIRQFNELVNKVDEEVAQQDMDPDKHGNIMLRKLSESLKLHRLSLTVDEEASLVGALRYMIESPDDYVHQYEFYGENTYIHNKIDIIVTLKNKYEKNVMNLGGTEIHYSNEELLVIWTVINIMVQIIDNGDDESEKKEHADIFSGLLHKFAPLTAIAEKDIS